MDRVFCIVFFRGLSRRGLAGCYTGLGLTVSFSIGSAGRVAKQAFTVLRSTSDSFINVERS